jgi:hypothetical protein
VTSYALNVHPTGRPGRYSAEVRDADVRLALVDALARQLGARPHVLVPEVEVRWSIPARLDALLVTNRICGFEIKSDRDSLSRLSRQAEAYSAVVERAVLVVGERHIDAVRDHVPDWWNIWLARRRGQVVRITKVRSGRLNPDVSALAVTSFMTREAVIAALRSRGHDRLSMRSVDQLRQHLATEVDRREALRLARAAMLARPDWRGRSLLAA